MDMLEPARSVRFSDSCFDLVANVDVSRILFSTASAASIHGYGR